MIRKAELIRGVERGGGRAGEHLLPAFRLAGREAALIVSSFVDAGRVFDGGGGWHTSYGGGLRLQYGRDFLIATDVGHSRESSAPIYIGLGYLF